MAHTVNLSLNYCTHLPALMRALVRTSGPVLELGMGFGSTPYLHYECQMWRRRLVSIETDAGWASIFKPYASDAHAISVVPTWDAADLSGFWDVALIDHSPGARRVTEIRRLANTVRYMIIHDSDPDKDSEFQYSTIYPLFAHRTDWTGDKRQATVLSNYDDLGDFWG